MGTQMMPPTAVEQTKELMKAPASKTVKDLLLSDAFKSQVAMSLPRHMKPERFIRVALNATMRQPELLECQRESLFLALLQLSSLGIEADGRRAHLIPFWDKGTCACGHKKEEHRQGQCSKCSCNICRSRRLVQLIVDYKGLAELVRRSGDVSYIHADVVLEGDDWDFQFGSAAFLRHKPNLELGTIQKRRMVAVYSFVKLKDGSEDFIVLSKADVDAIRQRSKSKDSGPWVTDYAEMSKKTAFRRHSKWLPLSPEVQDAIAADDEGEGFGDAAVILDGLPSVSSEEPPDEPEETLADRVRNAAEKQKQADAGQQASQPAQEGTQQASGTPADPVEPPAETEAPGAEKRQRRRKVPKDLYNHEDWERCQDSEHWGEPFVKVNGEVFELVEGNYRKVEG